MRSLLQDAGKEKPSRITEYLNISIPTINKYLKELFQNWKISKIWSKVHNTYLIPQVNKKEKNRFFIYI